MVASNLDTILEPNPGPQTDCFESEADIVIYGGSAGGGKSWTIVHDPLRYVDLPGFRAIIFRRTYPELTGQGGLWDECQPSYRALGASLRDIPHLDAEFESGARIKLSHLQHEKDKYSHQGLQYAFVGFDELTHFTETMFFYMLSRLRTTCGIRPYVRCTCNPKPGWVADFLAWWIGEDGYAIQDRIGKLRYFYRDSEGILHWSDSKQELIEEFDDIDENDIMSVTFIRATLDDNPKLLERDPGYKGRLKAQSKIERARLLDGNWNVAEGTQIDSAWVRRYVCNQAEFNITFQDHFYRIPFAKCQRFATIDTAGTSKEKAAVTRGKQPSWSICAVWDHLPHLVMPVGDRKVILSELLFLRYVWRGQVDWSRLVAGVDDTLAAWEVPKAYVENAHFGPVLAKEVTACKVELVGPCIPGMGDNWEGAKLERAVASKMLARWEHGKIFVPLEQSDWLKAYLRVLLGWTGKPDEPNDDIDVTSYAAYVSKRSSAAWGGVIKT